MVLPPAYSENDGMPWNNPDVKIEADIEKAKKFLAEDGWEDVDGDGIVEKNGLKAEFKCIYPSGDSVRQAIAMAAAEQVKEIGINIVVEGISWDEISKRMFSDAVLMGWGSSNPYTSYLLFHSKNKLRDDYYNPEGFNNATVDGYLDAALHAGTSEEAYDNWKLAQWDGITGTSMRGECPRVWLVNIQHIYYVADGLILVISSFMHTVQAGPWYKTYVIGDGNEGEKANQYQQSHWQIPFPVMTLLLATSIVAFVLVSLRR